MKLWQVYLVKCADSSLYCGITNDLESRIEAHNDGKGAKYTRGRLPVSLVAASSKMTRSQTLKFELSIKKLPARHKISTLQRGRFPNDGC